MTEEVKTIEAEEIKKEPTEEEKKNLECVNKIQAILDEYGVQIGVAGFVIIPKK